MYFVIENYPILATRNKDNLQKVTVPKNKIVIASCSSVIDIKGWISLLN